MALSDEINSCSLNADMGPRVRSRPQEFCEDVTFSKNITVAMLTTTTDCTVVNPLITVGGVGFAPVEVIALNGVFQVLGVLSGPAPEAPPTDGGEL